MPINANDRTVIATKTTPASFNYRYRIATLQAAPGQSINVVRYKADPKKTGQLWPRRGQ